jgi:hypothetical protein
MNFFCRHYKGAQQDADQFNRAVGNGETHSAHKDRQKAKISDDPAAYGKQREKPQFTAAQAHGEPKSRRRANDPKQHIQRRGDAAQRKPPAHDAHTVVYKPQPRAQQKGKRELKGLA